jgi:dCMP deaminase
MKKAYKKQLIEQAVSASKRSRDPHLKVGAVLIHISKNLYTRGSFVSLCCDGYNHVAKSHKLLGYKDDNDRTRPEVIHAEAHAISYLMDNDDNIQGKDCQLFCTLSPCMECAKLIYLSGIKKIYFKDYYKDTYPIDFLEMNKIKCEQIL